MKKAIIFGTEQYSEMLLSLLNKDSIYKVAAFTVDRKYIKCDTFLDLPVVPFEDIEEVYNPDEYGIFVCIGYTNMNLVREEKVKRAMEMGYEILDYVHPTAIVQAKKMGIGNIVMEGAIIGQGCEIGDGNIFWPMSHVAHHTKVGNYNFFTISCAIAGNINIHDYCVFGNNCTVKNGVDIANFTLIGAGAYISKSTEEKGVYVPPRSYKLEGKTSIDFKL